MKNVDTYLGDGLYAKDDGYHIVLWTERTGEGVHYVALEDSVLDSLVRFIERERDVKVTIESAK